MRSNHPIHRYYIIDVCDEQSARLLEQSLYFVKWLKGNYYVQ